MRNFVHKRFKRNAFYDWLLFLNNGTIYRQGYLFEKMYHFLTKIFRRDIFYNSFRGMQISTNTVSLTEYKISDNWIAEVIYSLLF